MPPRPRGRRASPPVLILEDEDLDFEVSYSEGEDGDYGGGSDSSPSSSSLSGEEGTDVEDGARSEEEEEEGEESVAEGCGLAVQARVPGGGATAQRAANAPTCPVCMEPWTSEGEHRISCIPCGHVYGRSCLERWLTQHGNASATCPQCGRRFKHKDIINIYAPEVAVPNNDLEKQLWFCRQKLESLEEVVLKQGKLLDEIVAEKNHRSTHGDVGVSKRQKIGEHSDGRTYLEPSASTSAASASSNSCLFVLLKELSFDGARVMGIDASNQIILASGKAPGVGGEHVLRKISMLSNHEARTIQLPPDTKVVKDICILPGGSALFASLGKRLSLFSMMTDSVVLQCNLPVSAWSCSAHDSDSHRVYAGLQDGRVLVFDTRQPSRPLHSMAGLSKHLVHTLHSVTDNSGSRKVLSASAIGPCMWDADGNQSSPKLLLEDNNQRVCFSLACSPLSSDLLVASYRPKADYSSGDAAPSQVYLSQTPTQSGAGKLGQHTVITRTGRASFVEGSTCHSNVSEVRMCKSAIVPCGHGEHLFAYGDELHRGVLTWQLPSLGFHSGLRTHRHQILDLRYAGSPAGGADLGCLSDDKLQVYRVDR
ncbi:E3 ubiquitin-protein ligase RFWD3-like [Hordeum vulgare subsp. vulgare]|uniref:RING-type E3 ubiquitin transferase n=1 Tax=Hordeum vulgare subsp. vulgare TaxID=112509 RepID=A0A8I6X6T7_HORVV|nr:E3 ubiquitin-protein ligase RFWD3-like [Hordeum vulgare subsp. vulgare]